MHGFSFENILYAKATWANNLVAPLVHNVAIYGHLLQF
jgi:hypothetical protein